MKVRQSLRDNSGELQFGWVGHTAKLLARDGFDVRAPMAEAGIRHDGGLIDDRYPVDPASFLLMCALVINTADDEMHGAARTRMSRGTANLAVKAMASARTLRDAIETATRFFSIAGAYCRLNLVTSDEEAMIQVSSDCDDPLVQQVMEELFATFLHIQLSHILEFLLPVTRFGATAATHPRLGQWHSYFRSRVVLSNVTVLAFPAFYLESPPRARLGANPLLEGELAWIARHAEARSGIFLGQDDDTLGAAVFRHLLKRDSSIEDCGRALCVEPTELRRRLGRDGTSFRRLRRAALLDRARPFLQAGATVEDLAEALGYSDGRSCRRALKSATGLGIAELRAGDVPPVGGADAAVLERLISEKQRQI